MKELGITKGEWVADELDYVMSISTKDTDVGGDIICDAPEYAEISMTRWRYNAALICDAGNTAQKCGLLPSDLLKQRDELREALTELVHLHGCEQEGIGSGQPTPKQWYDAVNKAEAAIKNTESHV